MYFIGITSVARPSVDELFNVFFILYFATEVNGTVFIKIVEHDLVSYFVGNYTFF